MRESLVSTVEPVRAEDIFAESIESVANSLEVLINSKTASLPKEGVNQRRKIWKILRRLISSNKVQTISLRQANKYYRVSVLTLSLLRKYQDFLDDNECQLLKKIYSISFAGAEIIEGLYYLYEKADVNEDTVDLNDVATGISLLSKGLRKYTKFINLQSYKSFKRLAQIILGISEAIKTEVVQSKQESEIDCKDYQEFIYLNAVSILWLIEQFEKKIINKTNRETTGSLLDFLKESINQQDETSRREKQVSLINLWIEDNIGEEHSTEECLRNIDESRERKLFAEFNNNS